MISRTLRKLRTYVKTCWDAGQTKYYCLIIISNNLLEQQYSLLKPFILCYNNRFDKNNCFDHFMLPLIIYL